MITGLFHIAGHFFISSTFPDVVPLTDTMHAYKIRILGGETSLAALIDGLNVMYGLFLIFIGGFNLLIMRFLSPEGIPSSVAALNVATLGTGCLISMIYFLWLHVTYFAIFTGFFFAAWLASGQRNAPQAG